MMAVLAVREARESPKLLHVEHLCYLSLLFREAITCGALSVSGLTISTAGFVIFGVVAVAAMVAGVFVYKHMRKEKSH